MLKKTLELNKFKNRDINDQKHEEYQYSYERGMLIRWTSGPGRERL